MVIALVDGPMLAPGRGGEAAKPRGEAHGASHAISGVLTCVGGSLKCPEFRSLGVLFERFASRFGLSALGALGEAGWSAASRIM